MSTSLRTPQGCKTATSTTTQLAYHRKIVIEDIIESGFRQRIRPQNGIHPDETMFDFHVNVIRASMINIGKAMLYIKARILHASGRELTSSEKQKIAPISYLHHTMWKTSEVRWNQNLLNLSASYNIPYKSIFEAKLSVSKNHYGYLTGGLYYPDQECQAEKMSRAENSGFKIRSELAKKNILTWHVIYP